MPADGIDVIVDDDGRLWVIERTDAGYEAHPVQRLSGRSFFRKYQAVQFAKAGGNQ